MAIETNFPDQTYSASNKPSVVTLQADITTIETELDTVTGALVGTTDTQTLTNKTLTNPVVNFADTAVVQNVKARASLGTAQENIGAGAFVTVNLDTEQYDIGSDFNTGTYLFTAPVTGYYMVVGSAYLYGTLADQEVLELQITKNASTSVANNHRPASVANTGHVLNASDIAYLSATDTLKLQVKVASTATTDIYNQAHFTYMSIHLLSV